MLLVRSLKLPCNAKKEPTRGVVEAYSRSLQLVAPAQLQWRCIGVPSGQVVVRRMENALKTRLLVTTIWQTAKKYASEFNFRWDYLNKLSEYFGTRFSPQECSWHIFFQLWSRVGHAHYFQAADIKIRNAHRLSHFAPLYVAGAF